jgi:hypothetical protein
LALGVSERQIAFGKRPRRPSRGMSTAAIETYDLSKFYGEIRGIEALNLRAQLPGKPCPEICPRLHCTHLHWIALNCPYQA